MQKITFDHLTIEITRRCNMHCPHCMRGESQNIDIDHKYIDALLDQTELIGRLFFTGGEPTLALDTMDYILDQLYAQGIPVLGFDLFTNGLIYSERFMELVKEYGKYVDLSREACGQEADKMRTVHIGVSLDKYHENQGLCAQHYNEYKSKLFGFADVTYIKNGNNPTRLGRAVHLPGAVDRSAGYQQLAKQRIELFTKDIKPACQAADSYKLAYPDQHMVVCNMMLSATGNLTYAPCDQDFDSIDSATIVCSVLDGSIWDAIISYNCGKIPCSENQKYVKRLTPFRLKPADAENEATYQQKMELKLAAKRERMIDKSLQKSHPYESQLFETIGGLLELILK